MKVKVNEKGYLYSIEFEDMNMGVSVKDLTKDDMLELKKQIDAIFENDESNGLKEWVWNPRSQRHEWMDKK